MNISPRYHDPKCMARHVNGFRNQRRKVRGSSIAGLAVFLVGVLLIGFSFKLAYDMFLVPPEVRLGTGPEQTIQIDSLVQGLITVVIKVLLLIVMSGIGSLIATRGIKMYSHRQKTSAHIVNSEPKKEGS